MQNIGLYFICKCVPTWAQLAYIRLIAKVYHMDEMPSSISASDQEESFAVCAISTLYCLLCLDTDCMSVSDNTVGGVYVNNVPADPENLLTHTPTHTGIVQDGHGSSKWTVTSGFSMKKGKNPWSRNGKYRF